MKTKITLRTKITLTLVGSLALTGIFYAASPSPFATVPGPVGVAATGTDLLASEYCSQNIDSIDCFGNLSLFATIPGPVGSCTEKYIAIAPAQSKDAVPPWTPRDIFVTQGPEVYKVSGGSATLFATIPGCAEDHTGITFDHFGAFGYNLIVTCQSGGVWQVDSTGSLTQIADLSTGMDLSGSTNFDHTNTNLAALVIEGPAVVPKLTFGPYSGQILVADENNGQVHAIANTGTVTTVTYDVFDWFGAEAVHVIPSVPSTFCSGGSFFLATEDLGQLYQYPSANFAGLGGNILVTSEFGAGTIVISLSSDGTNYNYTFFDSSPSTVVEGSSFADPDVPAPTPTATATATATPTATATATATATPAATATATATPTPTPTPTVTPMQFFTSFVIGDIDAVVGNHVTFWGAQWWKLNHLSRGGSPASFKGFANSPNPNPPICGGTWQSDPGNSSGPPPSIPSDITVIVSSLITKSGPIISGDGHMMVIVHTDPGYAPNPGHEGTGTVTAVVCQ